MNIYIVSSCCKVVKSLLHHLLHQCIHDLFPIDMHANFFNLHFFSSGADLGGGGGGGSRGSGPPLSYMKNDVMHTAIYAAFCMLSSLDLQDCTSF